ncbi:MAG TPA: SPFH domain-containing protein [Phycisphaerales bacterium]|jgi:flotillin|nr:SPFH domain-containing protein [Phycisphaerales bacterium]
MTSITSALNSLSGGLLSSTGGPALTLAQNGPGGGGGASSFIYLGLIGAVCLVFLVVVYWAATRYKRCPSNRILVIYGRVGSGKAAKCLHGGGTIVWPLIQDYAYMSLEPLVIDIPLEGALSLNNIRVNVPSTFTVAISTDPVLMNNAAERLLPLQGQQIRELAQDIILGQLRLVIATLTIEEINKDREKFMALINENVAKEINKIGLDLINVNVRDITDESGYIQAIGKRAAAEAINRAKVEVAEQERDGAIGEAAAVRQRTVQVANEAAQAAEGQKKAEQTKRVALAALEATAITGEVQSKRDIEVTTAQREAEAVAQKKRFEQEQRIRVAEAEASARTGENTSSALVAESDAKLAEIKADTRRRSDVASAKATEAVLLAQREQELARLAKEQLAPQEVEKKRIEIAAGAEAEKRRIEAQGEADATLARFEAEAAGVQKVLEAKAEGYRRLIEACGSNPQVGPTLLLIEQLPKLVEQQVKAIQNLKIDKITVWDSGGSGGGGGGGASNGHSSILGGGGGRNTTAEWLSGLVGALPRLHELAQQAGIELPAALGKVDQNHDGSVIDLDDDGKAPKRK